MKIVYSKIAKVLGEDVMPFGVVLTSEKVLSGWETAYWEARVKQYWDCFWLGAALAIILMFVCFAIAGPSWWQLLLLLIPMYAYNILYRVEYVIKGNVEDISFEKHATWIADTWELPCEEKHHYVSFGWWRKNFGA